MGSGSPFMPITSSAPRLRSMTTSTGVPAVQPSSLVENNWSAPRDAGLVEQVAQRDTDEVGRGHVVPPTSLDTHVIVIVRSTSGRSRMSS